MVSFCVCSWSTYHLALVTELVAGPAIAVTKVTTSRVVCDYAVTH